MNFEYLIPKVTNDVISIKDESKDEIYHVPRGKIEKFFIFNYCRTCHSVQGSSIDDSITIFDWKFYFVNRKWLYTAITRATELGNVVFFTGQDDTFDEELLNKYLDTKVLNYKRQDKDANRALDHSNFITRDWLKSQFGKTGCGEGCGDCLRFEVKYGKIESNLSANRLDNDAPHHINNCVPLCVSCNQKLAPW